VAFIPHDDRAGSSSSSDPGSTFAVIAEITPAAIPAAVRAENDEIIHEQH
jgi:hypothetical protein